MKSPQLAEHDPVLFGIYKELALALFILGPSIHTSAISPKVLPIPVTGDPGDDNEPGTFSMLHMYCTEL